MARHRDRTSRRKTAQKLADLTRTTGTATFAPGGVVTAERPPTVDELGEAIRTNLRDIVADAQLVRSLTNTHQVSHIGGLTADAKAAMHAMAIADRRAQAERQKKGEPLGHGQIPTPGNAAAISVSDEISRTLHRILIDLVDYDLLTAVPTSRGIEKVAITASRIRLWVAAAGDADRAALERSAIALEQLGITVRAVVDGHPERSSLTEACPHCERQTLVILHYQQIIRCDRAFGDEHYQPCTCPVLLCECKQRPISYRHEWFAGRPSKSKQSWHELDRLIRKTNRKK